MSFPQYAMTVRAWTSEMTRPAAIAGKPVVVAEYHAAGKMPNYFRGRITRMAPVPGVLGYDEDRVIDLRTNTVVE